MSGWRDWKTSNPCRTWAGSSKPIWSEWSRPLTSATTYGSWGATTSRGPIRACSRRWRNETGHFPVFATMWRPLPPHRWAKGPQRSPTSMAGTFRWCRKTAETLQVNRIIQVGILHLSEWWMTSNRGKPMRSGHNSNNNRLGLVVPPSVDTMVPALQLGVHHHQKHHHRRQGHLHLPRERTGWFLGYQTDIFSGHPRCPIKGTQSSSHRHGWTSGITSYYQSSKAQQLKLPALQVQHLGHNIWGEWPHMLAWSSGFAIRRSWRRTPRPPSPRRTGWGATATSSASTCWRGQGAICRLQECSWC